MKLITLAKTALTAAALTFSIAGAQAQYPAFTGGGVVMLPAYGFYGPPIVLGPGADYGYGFGAPYGMGGYGYGGYGYTNPYSYGSYSYANPYAYGGYGYGDMNGTPGVWGGVPGFGNVGGVTIQGFNGPPVPPGYAYGYYPAPYGYDEQGNPVDANGNPIPEPPNQPGNTGGQTGRQSALSGGTTVRPAKPPLVQVRRAPYNRISMSYNGNTAGVSRITFMLQDRNHRVVSQDLLTAPPATAQLRRPASARYWAVLLEYQDGTTRTLTGSLR